MDELKEAAHMVGSSRPAEAIDAETDWSTRIPAAIKKAERWLEPEGAWRITKDAVAITVIEVALAQALWDTEVLFEEGFKEDWKPLGGSGKALIAFAEKVESLKDEADKALTDALDA